MSVHAMTWIYEHSQHKGGELLVLLTIGNHAGSDGWECWPSVALLARETRLTERQVRRCLRAIEASGEIHSTIQGGPHGANLYQIIGQPSLDLTPTSGGKDVRGGHGRPPGGDMGDRQGGHGLPPNRKESSVEPSEELLFKSNFDVFWETYPRKQGKGAARKAYAKARRKTGWATIEAAAARYRDDPNRTSEFTCLPATWLNQERWDDDPVPRANGQRRYENTLDRVAREAMEEMNGRRSQSSSIDAPRQLSR
jgi:hypothetical protein